MLMMTMLLAVGQAAAPAPSAEAAALGVKLAGTGTLAALLPIVEAKETAELVAAHPGLTAVEQAMLRATAHEVAAAGTSRVLAALGREYARTLTLAELRALVAFQTTPAARRYRTVQPGAIAAAMQALAGVDFKQETLAAFCKRTGKGCGK